MSQQNPSDMRTDRNGNEVTVIFIPRTRTSPQGEDVAFAVQNGPTNPYAAFQRHLQFNNPDSHQHLFAHRMQNGVLSPLTRTEFLNKVNSVSALAGFPPRQGHSIRIGINTRVSLTRCQCIVRNRQTNRSVEIRGIYTIPSEARTNPRSTPSGLLTLDPARVYSISCFMINNLVTVSLVCTPPTSRVLAELICVVALLLLGDSRSSHTIRYHISFAESDPGCRSHKIWLTPSIQQLLLSRYSSQIFCTYIVVISRSIAYTTESND